MRLPTRGIIASVAALPVLASTQAAGALPPAAYSDTTPAFTSIAPVVSSVSAPLRELHSMSWTASSTGDTRLVAGRIVLTSPSSTAPGVFVTSQISCTNGSVNQSWTASQNVEPGRTLTLEPRATYTWSRARAGETITCRTSISARQPNAGAAGPALRVGTASRLTASVPTTAYLPTKADPVHPRENARKDVILSTSWQRYATPARRFTAPKGATVEIISDHRASACVWKADLSTFCQGLTYRTATATVNTRVWVRQLAVGGGYCESTRKVLDVNRWITPKTHHRQLYNAVTVTLSTDPGCSGQADVWTSMGRVSGPTVAVHRPYSRATVVPPA